MLNERTHEDLSKTPILKEPQVYIYILQNSVGKVKVGKTHNIIQRINSLSGSNSQGNRIIKCYCSQSTYLYTIETVMHSRMNRVRIPDTEWFYYDEDPSGDILFDSAIELLEKLFHSKNYNLCNNLRKELSHV